MIVSHDISLFIALVFATKLAAFKMLDTGDPPTTRSVYALSDTWSQSNSVAHASEIASSPLVITMLLSQSIPSDAGAWYC